MIAKCQCQHCGGAIEFEVAEFVESGRIGNRVLGQFVPCPHCGKETIVSIESKPPPLPDSAEQAAAPVAGKIRTVDNFGGGVIVQIIGVVVCFTVVGVIIGIPLIIIGGQMARKLKCSNCGNRIADKGVKICPVCHFRLD